MHETTDADWNFLFDISARTVLHAKRAVVPLDTTQNRAAMPPAEPSRWVAPEALAGVIVFLASEAARAVRGAAVPVDGLS